MSASDEQRFGDEVAVGDRVERVLERVRELELVGDEVRIERQARSRERAGAQRRHVGAEQAVAPTIDVTRERPEVREQVVRQQHRLRALQVRVARQRDLVELLRPAATACAGAGRSARSSHGPRAGDTGADRARPGRCGCGRCAAWRRRGPAISVTRRSIAVWMSSSLGANANDPLAELFLDPIERGDDHRAFVVGEQADARQHRDVRARPDEVVGRQPAVERQADREREQFVGRAFAEPSVPERLAARGRARSLRHPGLGGATTSRPTSPTAARSPPSPRVGTSLRRRTSRGRGRTAIGGRAGRPRRTGPVRAAAAPRR